MFSSGAAPSRSPGITTLQRFGQMEMIEMGLMGTKDGSTKDGDFTMRLDWLNALLTWRGILNPLGTCRFDETRHRCQVAAWDIQRAYGEALGRQTDLLVAAWRQLGHCDTSRL
jgi:hypothetical protein